MSNSSQSPPAPPSGSASASAQPEQARRQDMARDLQEAREREARDRARQEETARRERQRLEEAQRRAAALTSTSASSSAPPHGTTAIATASQAHAADLVAGDDLLRERKALVQMLANRAASQQVRTALVTVLAERPRADSRKRPATPRTTAPSLARPIEPVFSAAWTSGERSLFGKRPTTWQAVVATQADIQHAVVEAWLEEREAATMSVWRRVRIVAALLVIAGLVLGAIVLLLAV